MTRYLSAKHAWSNWPLEKNFSFLTLDAINPWCVVWCWENWKMQVHNLYWWISTEEEKGIEEWLKAVYYGKPYNQETMADLQLRVYTEVMFLYIFYTRFRLWRQRQCSANKNDICCISESYASVKGNLALRDLNLKLHVPSRPSICAYANFYQSMKGS